MARRWVAYAEPGREHEVEAAVDSIGPHEPISFAHSASELRELLRDEEPRTVNVAVGHTGQGVSEVNLAAALVADGYADEVILAVRETSGSLRSRASQAGIARVIDVNDLASRGLGADETADLRGATLATWRAERSQREARSQGRAPIVTLASGRGGVGKTAIVSVIAAHAARWGMRVALVDLDLTCGNLGNSFGAQRCGDLGRLSGMAVVTPTEIASLGVTCGERLSLWGPCERPEMAETVMPHIEEVLEEVASVHDLVVVDTSSTCTDAVAQAMQLADRLVLVHDMRPGGIAAIARMSALAVRLGVARTRIARVENRCAARSWGQAFVPRAEVGLETARPFRVLEGGEEVAELLAAGRLDELLELDGDFVRSSATFLAQLLKELGCLPQDEEAQVAEEGSRIRRMPMLFGRRREVG